MPDTPRVLIVDDNPRMRESLSSLLSDKGYALKQSSNGKSAVDNLNRENFDLVLLDMVMPDMSGIQVMDHINRKKLKPLVIVLTGNVTTDSAIGALRRGAYDYIRKPFEPEELLKTIRNGLDHQRLKRENVAINKKLALSENRYRFLVQNSPDIIYTLDRKGNFTFISNAVEVLLKYTIDQLIGKHYSFIIHEDDMEKAKWAFAERRTGDRAASGIELRLKICGEDGRLDHCREGFVTIELKSNGIYDKPISEKNKKFLGTHGVVRDINDRKHLEEQLHHAKRMEALGTLAGGISHDFNNLLMGIQGRTSLMMMSTEDVDPNYVHLKGIEDHVKSAADLVKQLLGFARRGKYEVKTVDLNRLINKTSNMFRRTKKEITIRRKYEKNLFPAEVDTGQIELVLLNLYVNAWQAMPQGGVLDIRTENVTADKNLPSYFQIEPGRYVKISVSDTGIGMDEATRKRIFDPFFTTKEIGRGTGLGLASAYGIVQNHKGFITVDSQVGEGSTFHVFLPASEKEIVSEQEINEDLLKGSETILLVDDEEIILEVGKQLLEKMKYMPLTANSGLEALDIYRQNREQINLVILDMIMPEMGGGETYNKLKEINPDIKVLLSSGYSVNGQATEILGRGCNGFIQKPFSIKKLSRKIREILDQG